MKLNMKGFTLVELLAVIVILAIIALITIPVIANIISEVQDSADARSVEAYAKAVESKYYLQLMQGSDIVLEEIKLDPEDYNGAEVKGCKATSTEANKLKLTGCTVGNRDVKFNYENGKATQATTSAE